MTAVEFLNAIKEETDELVADLILPCKPQKDDDEAVTRCPSVWKQRLTKSSAAQRIAPYILHQVITANAHQEPGERDKNTLCLRTIVCVYNEDEQEGSMALLTVIERLRVHWLRTCVVDNRFLLDKEQGLDYLIYPDETNDFYIGEMVSYWKLPPIEREVSLSG